MELEFLRFIEGYRFDFLTTLNLLFSKCGEEIIIVSILCLIYWCINKKLGYAIGFAYCFSAFIVNTVKLIARIPRPFVRDTSLNPVKGAIKHATGYSFPSGHTQSAFSVYGSLGIYVGKKNRILGALLFLPAILIGCSRMYLGVHTYYDVAVGLLIGVIVAVLVQYFMYNYSMDKDHYRTTLIIITILSFVLIEIGAYSIEYRNVGFRNGKDAMTIGCLMLGFIFGWYIEKTKVNFDEKAVSLGFQILKYLLGMIGVGILFLGGKLGFEAIFGKESYIAVTVPYVFTTFWITGVYPLIIKKYFGGIYKYKH